MPASRLARSPTIRGPKLQALMTASRLASPTIRGPKLLMMQALMTASRLASPIQLLMMQALIQLPAAALRSELAWKPKEKLKLLQHSNSSSNPWPVAVAQHTLAVAPVAQIA